MWIVIAQLPRSANIDLAPIQFGGTRRIGILGKGPLFMHVFTRPRRRRSPVALVTSFALLLGTVSVLGGVTSSAAAEDLSSADAAVEMAAAAVVTDPVADPITADALPTVQIDGVVWQQATVGDTVFVAGSFGNARPAGNAAGIGEIPRNNFLSFSIVTGELNSSFAPTLNAQSRAVAATPDGTRVFVGGDFTNASGERHYRLAAYDVATGKIVSTFTPEFDGPVKSLYATNSTLYVGGAFTAVNGVSRTNLAAVSTSGGSLTSWDPTADASVNAMVLTPKGDALIIGGMFFTVNGVDAYGMASVDAATGAIRPWAANQTIRSAGPNGTIASLVSDGTSIIGAGWARGSGANFEGTFSADPDTGAINWMEDCHGDTYSVYPLGGAVYSVGHPHDCNTIGGFPQKVEWHRATSFVNAPTGTVSRNFIPNYGNFAGQPATSLRAWFPLLEPGLFTGMKQAAWSITGNTSYVSLGGEFPTANNVGQQGLVRFAVRSKAPKARGPEVSGALSNPVPISLTSGTVRVGFRTNWDRDTQKLTYKVVRDGNTAAPVYTTTADSFFWNRPYLAFTDTGLAPGSTHTYRLYATDGIKTSASSTVSVVVSDQNNRSAYWDQVAAGNPTFFWRLGEPSGASAYDWVSGTDATVTSAVTRGAQGAAVGNDASTFDGTAASAVTRVNGGYAPTVFTVQAWVKTTSTSGGQIMGFGSAITGASTYNDRSLYMDNGGRLYFGVTPVTAPRSIASSAAYNNGLWHQVTATLSSAGMKLYVDGALVASRTDTTNGFNQYGWWRVGGDTLTSFPGTRSSNFLKATIDEVAVYPSELTASRISSQYAARSATATNQPPTASFSTSATGLTMAADGTGSFDPDGTIASYAWDFGDSTTGTGATTSHKYAAAGTYTVTLRVTDNIGASNSTTRSVSIVDPTAPLALDDFGRTVAAGFGTAPTGGAWSTTSTTAGSFDVGSGVGHIVFNNVSTGLTASLNSVSTADVDMSVDMAVDKLPAGSGVYVALQARKVGSTMYRLRATVSKTGVVTLQTYRVVSNSESAVDTAVDTGVTVTPGSSVRVRFQVTGTGTATLVGKAWNPASAEPADWQLTRTDSTAGLQGAGVVGLYGYVFGSTTNVPLTVSVDNFKVARP